MNLMFLISYLIELKNVRFNRKNGYDQRYNIIEDKSALKKIIENNEKKNVLNCLESNNVSLIYKLNKIDELNKLYYEDSDPKIGNLSKGGLFCDWNFEI